MNVIDSLTQDLLDKTEFLVIVTQGLDGPHLAGNWVAAQQSHPGTGRFPAGQGEPWPGTGLRVQL